MINAPFLRVCRGATRPAAGAARGWLACAGLAVALVVSTAMVSRADYSAVQVSNSYLKLIAGTAGSVDNAGPYLNTTINVSGWWTLGSTGGDPETPVDNNSALLAGYPVPWGAFTIIKVDDKAAIIYGSSDNGSWQASPTNSARQVSITDSYLVKDTPILVTRSMKLLRDTVRVEFQITNNDTAQHKVGLATYLDTEYGADQVPNRRRGGPFYTALTGPIQNEQSLTGQNVPDVIFGFDGLPDYNIATQCLLSGGELTTPDKVTTTVPGHSMGDFWGFEPIDAHEILDDSGLLLYWNQTAVPAGRSRAPIVFYFGMGQATSDFNYPAVLAAQGPFAVKYERAADSSVGDLTPNPFTVTGYVYNLDPDVPLSQVQLQIALSPGLSLADGETSVKSVGAVGAQDEGSASWQVVADGSEPGALSYTISVVGFPLTSKSVTRTVNVPAVEARTFFGDTWEMVSVPFVGADPQPPALFGLGSAALRAIRFNPVTAVYEDVIASNPGEGFWFRPVQDVDVTLQNATPVTNSSTQPYLITLKPGWNMIGNPYLYSSVWGRYRVLKDPTKGSVPLKDAVASNWIRGTVYWYDIEAGDYGYSSSPFTAIKPWSGYWVRALQSVVLVAPPADPVGGLVTVSSAASGSSSSATEAMMSLSGAGAAGREPWGIRLSATGSVDGRDTNNFVGEEAGASDGYDSRDVEKAPPAGSLMLSVLNKTWGANSGRYARDVRATGPSKLWNCEVRSGVSQKVTLSWDTMKSLPKGTSLRLYDQATRRSVVMRPGGSYTFQADAGTPKLFQLVANRRGGRVR